MVPDTVVETLASIPTNKVKVAITDMDGILRGKIMHKQKFLGAAKKGFGFCDVVFGWDMSDQTYDECGLTGWHTGFPDMLAMPDLQSFRSIPWESNMPFFIADMVTAHQHPHPICPRQLLKSIRERAIERGFYPMFGQEYEWFNFQENAQDLHDRGFTKPTPMTNGMFGYSILRSSQKSQYFNDLFDLLERFQIPLEGLHTETGPGVYEAAIYYSDILEAADRSVLFKTSVKEIAHRHGIMPTFMARWSEEYPGCSGHIHQSLWTVENEQQGGRNVFFQDGKMSPIMEHYIAGQLACLPYILPLYAPNINSYKRLVKGHWAPTQANWGVDNRTVAIRALPGDEKASRIEMRVPGSDMNPYLAMAASLASGLYGIENELPLERPVSGNGYEDNQAPTLARTLEEAISEMENSQLACELFGEQFVSHFLETRKWEVKAQLQQVSNWELKRYFEII